MKKSIAILGSTGSIGTQALDVIREHRTLFDVEVLTARNNTRLLVAQAREFIPNAVVIGNEEGYEEVRDQLNDLPVKVYAGDDAIGEVVSMEGIDLVLHALVGYSGLLPALKTIQAGKDLAIANKESLVIAGELLIEHARRQGSLIIPVDSEHSAIFQCLRGEPSGSAEKIFLTASGGPFRGFSAEQLKTVTRADALNHPKWKMGSKITVDSATLMNKGLEVIEASWLFNLKPEKIEVVVHPQSIIHSMVQFTDGSIKAQMGLPDMRLPIAYALGYPGRIPTLFPRFSFSVNPVFTFELPDRRTFRSLDLAYNSIEQGGSMPCVMNAANEVAVHAFLNEQIGFIQIPEVVEYCMEHIQITNHPTYDDLVNTHKETIRIASDRCDQISFT